MRALMLAPPGAAKGTYGALIATRVAIGNLLRYRVAKQTELGQAVERHLDGGELVPDAIVLDLVREAFVAAKAATSSSSPPG